MSHNTIAKTLSGAQLIGAVALQLFIAYLTLRSAAGNSSIPVLLLLMFGCAVVWNCMLLPSAKSHLKLLDDIRRRRREGKEVDV